MTCLKQFCHQRISSMTSHLPGAISEEPQHPVHWFSAVSPCWLNPSRLLVQPGCSSPISPAEQIKSTQKHKHNNMSAKHTSDNKSKVQKAQQWWKPISLTFFARLSLSFFRASALFFSSVNSSSRSTRRSRSCSVFSNSSGSQPETHKHRLMLKVKLKKPVFRLKNEMTWNLSLMVHFKVLKRFCAPAGTTEKFSLLKN